MLQLRYTLVLVLIVSIACIPASIFASIPAPLQLPLPAPTSPSIPAPIPPAPILDVPIPIPDILPAPTPPLVRVTVTAYSSSPDETSGDPFITASGRRVFDGLVACPRSLPFGTVVKIGTRLYHCFDRLHQKYDDRFDIWMATKDAALLFGKRQLLVQIMRG